MSELVAEQGGPGLAELSGRLHPRLGQHTAAPSPPGPPAPSPRPPARAARRERERKASPVAAHREMYGYDHPVSFRGVVGIGASAVGQTRQSSSTRLSLARSAATASPSALNSSSVMPGRRRTVNTTSDPLSSAITLIGT
jgi:hypothetical protein